jgi:hypothetical protein
VLACENFQFLLENSTFFLHLGYLSSVIRRKIEALKSYNLLSLFLQNLITNISSNSLQIVFRACIQRKTHAPYLCGLSGFKPMDAQSWSQSSDACSARHQFIKGSYGIFTGNGGCLVKLDQLMKIFGQN